MRALPRRSKCSSTIGDLKVSADLTYDRQNTASTIWACNPAALSLLCNTHECNVVFVTRHPGESLLMISAFGLEE